MIRIQTSRGTITHDFGQWTDDVDGSLATAARLRAKLFIGRGGMSPSHPDFELDLAREVAAALRGTVLPSERPAAIAQPGQFF